MVTPLRGRDELDVEGLERLVERLVVGGCAGVFILGTTGEGSSLSYRLRRDLIERVCQLVNQRITVLVGITDTAFIESVHLARFANEAGADAVVSAPPYYLPGGQPELCEWMDHLLEELEMPLFLYNIPSLTKVEFELETVKRAMTHTGVVGLKDSSGKLDYFREIAGLRSSREDWSLLMGPQELLLESLQLGGHGGVSGGANVFPELYVELYQAALRQDQARVDALNRAISSVADALFRVGTHSSSIIKGIKCALACLGVCDDFMAEPFHRFRPEARARIQHNLESLTRELDILGLARVS